MNIYTCEICGKNYIHTANWQSKHTCSDKCYKKRRSQHQQVMWRTKIKYQRAEKQKEKERKRHMLADVNEDARANDMTYGQYQAMLYMRTQTR